MNGTVKKGQKIKFICSRAPRTKWWSSASSLRSARPCEQLRPGQVGYLICNIKSLKRPHRRYRQPSPANPRQALPGYEAPKRMVFCGLYPSDGQDFRRAARSAHKLSDQRPQLRVRTRNQRRVWASASAAASSACCTWKSCSSGSNKRPTSTWCRPRRTSPTKSSRRTARPRSPHAAARCPTSGRHRRIPPADRARELSCSRPTTSAAS
jgi:hypothetical protein